MRKLTDDQITEVREMQRTGSFYREIGDALGVHSSTVRLALNPKARERHCFTDAERRRADGGRENRLRCAEYTRTHKKENRLRCAAYYQDHRKEERLYWMASYHKEEKAAYRKAHKEEKAVYDKAHLSEHAARSATRYAKIQGATIGDPEKIKEIYRMAKEAPRVRCYLCGDLIPVGHRHVDHIMPLKHGGQHRPSNLAVVHDTCNLEKHDKLPEGMGILV